MSVKSIKILRSIAIPAPALFLSLTGALLFSGGGHNYSIAGIPFQPFGSGLVGWIVIAYVIHAKKRRLTLTLSLLFILFHYISIVVNFSRKQDYFNGNGFDLVMYLYHSSFYKSAIGIWLTVYLIWQSSIVTRLFRKIIYRDSQ